MTLDSVPQCSAAVLVPLTRSMLISSWRIFDCKSRMAESRFKCLASDAAHAVCIAVVQATTSPSPSTWKHPNPKPFHWFAYLPLHHYHHHLFYFISFCYIFYYSVGLYIRGFTFALIPLFHSCGSSRAVLCGSTDIFVGGRLRLSCRRLGNFTFWLQSMRFLRGLRDICAVLCGFLRL